MDKAVLKTLLQDSGVVGAGGAGFPTYAKIDERAQTIILNCCECEPLLRLHRQLLEKHPDEVLTAFHTVMKTVGAKEGIIGLKKAYTKTIEALNSVLDKYEGLRIKTVDQVYPAGDEVVLIYEVTGKVVRPGGLPIESGVAVFNVETMYNLYKAMQGEPVTDKLVTLACEVKKPKTVRVPLGATLEEVVKLGGGETVEDSVYFVGGPMMGNIMPKTATVTKTTNAILVLPKDHYLVKRKNSNNKINLKRAAASCCQCNMCTDLCPRNLLGHPIDPSRFMLATICKNSTDTQAFMGALYCSNCGLCELYACTQELSPRTLLAEMKNALRIAGVKPDPNVQAKGVNKAREHRKAPLKRLAARLNLTQYISPAPLENEFVSMDVVKECLSQHIGAPAVPVVKQGTVVKKGQLIAQANKGLSVNIHASIDGLVTDVTKQYIEIKKIR